MNATNTGMNRPVDELGRIVLPAEIRRSYGIEEKDKLDISVCEEGILLMPINAFVADQQVTEIWRKLTASGCATHA